MEPTPSPAPTTARPVTWTWVDVLLIGATSVGVVSAGSLGLGLLLRLSRAGQTGPARITLPISLGMVALEALALVGSVYLLGLRRRRLPWAAVGLRPAGAGWLVGAGAIGLACVPLTGLVATLVQLLLGRPLEENSQAAVLAPEGFSWLGAIGMLLLTGVAVPFAEELFFRGTLYTWLRQRWGVTVGTVVSTLVFGLVHVEPAVVAAGLVLGLIQAIVYERSRSLWTVVLIHAVNNSAKVVLLYGMLALGLATAAP